MTWSEGDPAIFLISTGPDSTFIRNGHLASSVLLWTRSVSWDFRPHSLWLENMGKWIGIFFSFSPSLLIPLKKKKRKDRRTLSILKETVNQYTLFSKHSRKFKEIIKCLLKTSSDICMPALQKESFLLAHKEVKLGPEETILVGAWMSKTQSSAK